MKKDKYRLISTIIVLTIIDQVIKYIISINKENMPISIIKNIIQLNYVENFGVAFGIASGGKSIFIIANIIIIGIILKFLFTQSTSLNNIKKFFLSIIISGGIGNLIDRVFRGFVIDYIDFSQIVNYPVFNFADIMIVIGTIIFAIFIIKDMINDKKENKKE